MTTFADALILGTVQGLTEFLPISSSGHLKLGHAWLGYEVSDSLVFDLVLHIGTLLAVALVYGPRIAGLVRGVVTGLADVGRGGGRAALERHEGLRYLLLLVVASIPTAAIGLLLEEWVEQRIAAPQQIGALLLVNGAMLFSSRWFGRGSAPDRGPLSVGGIGLREALIIGVVQGVAVLPGISRSGSTITAALAVGGSRSNAAEFSFFLSIPAILGAVVLKVDPVSLARDTAELPRYLMGMAVSAVVGVFALRVVIGTLNKAQLHGFAYYCWALGLAAVLIG